MIGFKRVMKNGKYSCEYIRIPLAEVANAEKKVPLDWITEDGTGLKQAYIDYALPLIQGDCKAPLEDGLPRFARLKKVFVEKK
jgi:6-phosphofructokinase 1